MRILAFILLFALFSLASSGQQLFYDVFCEEEGLTNLVITEIIQDKNGYLWIGTENGLFRFDGERIREISRIKRNFDIRINDLLIDDQNTVWVASDRGVISYNGSEYQHYALENINAELVYDHLMQRPDGTIGFFYGGSEYYYIDGDEIEVVDNQVSGVRSTIADIYQTSADTIWLLTGTGEIYGLLHNKLTQPLHIPLPDADFIRFQDAGHVLTTRGVVEIQLDDKNKMAEAKSAEDSPGYSIWYNENDQYRWFEIGNQLVCVDKEDTLDSSIGIPDNVIPFFYKDMEGSTWIGIPGSGLYRIAGYDLCHLSDERMKGLMPSSFMEKNEELWVAYFGEGIRILSGDTWSTINTKKGLISDYVRSLLHYNNDIWVITARGVTRITPDRMISYTTGNGLPNNYCYDGNVGHNGNIFIGTESGVAVFRNDKFHMLTVDDGLSNNRIKKIQELPDGSMLFMSDDVIDLYSNGSITVFAGDLLRPKEVLNTVARDSFGNYWLGSEMYGLICLNPDTESIRYVSEEMDLPFSRVRSISICNTKTICIGTESGIYFSNFDEQGRLVRIIPLGRGQGYPDIEVNQNAVIHEEEGTLFGSNLGIIILRHNRINESSIPPPVMITGVDVSFNATDWTDSRMRLDTWNRIPERPVLNYDENDFLLYFKAVSLKSSHGMIYKYKLENYENEWSAPSSDTSALYANLIPGKYTFKVKASYDGVNWGETATAYHMIIAPPFWRSWWFYVIAFSFLLVGFIFFNNYRIKTKLDQLIAIEEVKKEEYDKIQKKVAMDFHDEVGNHLTSISMLIQLINSKNWEVPGELKSHLERIDKESKDLFRGTGDFIWSIDPANDNLKAVFFKIRDYGMELFENTSIRFHVQNKNSGTSEIKLPAGIARQIVLIFKEGLNNALKHANCRNVYFIIKVDKREFIIRLKDDGKGFNTEELAYYEGIKKMKYRGSKIKSDLSLLSDKNEGTEIVLRAELNA